MQIGSAFIPAVPLAIGVYFCPESPRWYIRRKEHAKAYQSLLKLRNHPLLAARDLYYINAQIEVERDIIGDRGYVARFIELFTIPRVRRATLAAFTVMIAQQMCGINIIAFYSSTIFAQAGASTKNALLTSFGFGAVNFVFAWPAFFTIDTFGRRTLLLFTFPQMAWTLLAAGFCFNIPDGNSARLGCIALFIFLFAAFYSPGEGKTLIRQLMEFIVFTNIYIVRTGTFHLFRRGVPSLSQRSRYGIRRRNLPLLGRRFIHLSPTVVESIRLDWRIWVLCVSTTPMRFTKFYTNITSGMNVLALIMIFHWLPETKQRTLEELDYIFAVPTRRFISYQYNTWLPW